MPRVLVVDDEPAVRRGSERAMTVYDYSVAFAAPRKAEPEAMAD